MDRTNYVQHFHDHINQQHPNIQYTLEKEKDTRLAFLNVHVTKSPEGLSTCVYQKPTHTDRYILLHSHYHQRTTTGVLRCMHDRNCKSAATQPENPGLGAWRR